MHSPQLVDLDSQFAGARAYAPADNRHIRRDRQMARIDSKEQMRHARIADNRRFVYALRRDICPVRQNRQQLIEFADHQRLQPPQAVGFMHDVRNAAYDVVADLRLRVQGSSNRQLLAAVQVQQVGRQRSRPDVEGHAAALGRGIPCLERDWRAARKYSRNIETRLPDIPAQPLKSRQINVRPTVLHAERIQYSAEVGAQIVNCRFVNTDVLLGDCRTYRDVPHGPDGQYLCPFDTVRHIDDRVLADRRLAAEAIALDQLCFSKRILLRRSRSRRALLEDYFALPTEPFPAARHSQLDAGDLGSLADKRPLLNLYGLPGGVELHSDSC